MTLITMRWNIQSAREPFAWPGENHQPSGLLIDNSSNQSGKFDGEESQINGTGYRHFVRSSGVHDCYQY